MNDPLVFLLSVAAISLSGIMVPGPVLAATVAKGYVEQHAGLTISLGHGLVEFPLMVALYFGLRSVLVYRPLVAGIGVIGGSILILIGYKTLQIKERECLNLPGYGFPSLGAVAVPHCPLAM